MGHGQSIPTICCFFQPVFELSDCDDTDRSVLAGYEALARAHDDGDDSWNPLDLSSFGPQTEDVDRLCRARALGDAIEAGLRAETTLLINVEPATRDLAPQSRAERELFASARSQGLRVAIEVTERSLLQHPANVLRQVEFARSLGWGVAIDDVGANPDSLAMLPFISPDIVKLDLGIIQGSPDRDQARTVTAVMAHVERTGAAVIAEGVETRQHLEQARAFGATLFQGWLFGRPGPLAPRSRHHVTASSR